MIVIDRENSLSHVEREKLLDRVMGPARFQKSSELLRRGRLPADGLAFVAFDGKHMIGTVRLWNVKAGDSGSSLLLGPLAVEKAYNGSGVGAGLMYAALNAAQSAGHQSVLLVGDPDYYARFGFHAAPANGLLMPGHFDRHRFLGINLGNGDALSGSTGILRATGQMTH
ncbi:MULTISPECIES: GNAT family N-acetyltransferase [Thalassospira]|uniref:Acetyltransferase protein n=2 Tax=Thalassospira TaxID=168934 RepID=A0AB72UF58_9PROT|nr:MULTISPECIES: N-acetyltransferase [Thalassospira]AJD52821.1 acetyltransferase protein [Thalassospira xiamenensis M-5 = DSM 17429]KEO58081.1 acetyltransferase [Thalassospira permensis NBRC 106175]RCK41107.1 acetyltransferase [Thalassospira xiamenensis]SIT31222.1 Predicted N-acetyltransferase YhbS [Thalassospira xiamenensis M-5 = DSM 17429]